MNPTAAATRLHRLVLLGGWATAAAVAIATVAAGLPDGTAASAAVIALTVTGLALWGLCLSRRVAAVPVLVAALVGTGLAGAALDALHPSGPGVVLAYMAMTGLGFGIPRRPSLAAAAIVVAAAGWAEARTAANGVAAVLSLAAGAGFLYLAAAFAGVSREAHDHSRALLEQEAATREAREEAAVLAERGRLARELHDVLAHTLSGLAVQLEGARLLAERTGADPRLADQVTNAQRLARDGMVNARRAVATLRGEALPGPAQVPALVEQARLGGLPVTLRVHGEPRPLPSEAGLAVYRTVQEALTNAGKHAGDNATAIVALTWAETEVTAEVTDAGGDRVAAGLPSGGYGLAGLAERAALGGGRLDAGPTDDGWRVTLVLPIALEDRT
ncbi:histidine kinase [Dactylosporangium sp. NPDC000244]|uniref:sensor histidine kinase n=1 Tax=Dactylosporangium sp. NPDC000244 TaxID=3154365 RepID=UPI003330EEBD